MSSRRSLKRPAPAPARLSSSTRGFGSLRASLPIALALALACAVRFVVLAQLAGHPLLQPRGVLDDAVYVDLARRVASGDLLLGPDVYYVSPFYAYFLGLVFWLIGGSIFAARVIQVLLGTASVGLIMGAARSWFGERAALIAGLLAAVTGLFAFNEILILQSSLDTVLTSLSLFALARAFRTRSAGWFALAGLAFAALSLNRPNALACLVGVPLVWLVACRARHAVRLILAFALGAAVLVSPVVVRNRVVAGQWALITSHGGLNFYIGNSGEADGTWKPVPGVDDTIRGQIEDVRRVAAEALGRQVSSVEASTFFYDRAWGWIGSHPGAWAGLLLRKLALCFNAGDAALNYSYAYFAHDEATILRWLAVGPWLIVPLGVFGLFLGRREGEWRAYLAWASFAYFYAGTLVAFFVSSRYRLPLLVALVIGAGAPFEWFRQHLAGRARVTTLSLSAAALAVLFVFANWPMRIDDRRLWEREEHIVQLMHDGQIDKAERLLPEAERQDAEAGALLCRIALVRRGQRDATAAIRYLERAVAADPGQPLFHFDLGETLLQCGRAEEAVAHLRAATNAPGVSPATIAYDLAAAYRSLGQPAEAVAALGAIDVNPGVTDDELTQSGEAALALVEPRLAERFLRELVRRRPALAQGHDQLGVALGMQRQDREAVAELERAVALDPRSASAHYHLALGYAQTQRLADACLELERSLQLKPDNEEARTLLARLPPSPRREPR